MLKKIRVLIVALILGITITYAALPLDACFGCGSVEMCAQGGQYLGTGWTGCKLLYKNGHIYCGFEGFEIGICSGGNG